jgi:hypothetical protein
MRHNTRHNLFPKVTNDTIEYTSPSPFFFLPLFIYFFGWVENTSITNAGEKSFQEKQYTHIEEMFSILL